ncbi:unnamed protein product, partial [Amoebophrya sp. A120]|eukprot:GSA120T00014407001.1
MRHGGTCDTPKAPSDMLAVNTDVVAVAPPGSSNLSTLVQVEQHGQQVPPAYQECTTSFGGFLDGPDWDAPETKAALEKLEKDPEYQYYQRCQKQYTSSIEAKNIAPPWD